MKKLARILLVITGFMLFFPGSVLAKNGTITYEGKGVIFGNGKGNFQFVGSGATCVEGRGKLIVSKKAHIEIEGDSGIRTEDEKNYIYTNFNGDADINGRAITGSFEGDADHFNFDGRGRVTLNGKGKYTARGKMIKVNPPQVTRAK